MSANNIQSWMAGRVLSIETMLQAIELNPKPSNINAVLGGAAVSRTFSLTSLGTEQGEFLTHPVSKMPDGYDPRARPWYKNAVAAVRATSRGTPVFNHVDAYAGDPILSLMEKFKTDPRRDKVNLSIGLYYNDEGIVPALKAAIEAQKLSFAGGYNLGPSLYLPMEGLEPYRKATQELLFGAECSALVENLPLQTFQRRLLTARSWCIAANSWAWMKESCLLRSAKSWFIAWIFITFRSVAAIAD